MNGDITGSAVEAGCREILDAVSEPFGVLGRGLILHDVNRAGAELLGRDREELIGSSAIAYVPGAFAKSFNGMMLESLDHDRRLYAHGFFDGVYFRMHVMPLDDGAGAPNDKAAVWFTRSVIGQRPEALGGFEEVALEHHHLGDLSALTPREMAVLRLVGYGLSSKAIGKALHKSPRTIESNIIAIGRKLSLSSRVEMARFSIRSGLCDVAESASAAPLLDDDCFEAVLKA